MHKSVPHANFMNHGNMPDQPLGQEITWEISSAPRARELWARAPPDPTINDSTFQDLLHPQIKRKTPIFN